MFGGSDRTGKMIRSDRAQLLKTFLGGLPEAVATRLAKAIELDRLADGKSLPHELILEGLRPVLRRAHEIERTPTPLRLFCQPFQDLLSSAPRKEKLTGRIPHTSISLVWNWLSQALIPAECAAYCEAAKADILGFRLDNALLTAQEFWPVASNAISSALSSGAGLRSAKAVLGGDVVVADVREMALLLAIGPKVVELQRKFPNQTPALTEDLLWALRDIYDAVVATAPDSAPFVAVVAMNRLARPWEALRLPLAVSRQTQDTLISSTDMGLVGEILFSQIEMHAVAIRSARQPQFDADELLNHVASFATLSSGMVKEVEMRRDGRWGQRLLKDRAALAEVMDGYMKRAPREILAALPTLKSGTYAGGPRIPDVSHAPDPEKCARAMRYAKLVVGCRSFAGAASFGASLADALDEATTGMRIYCEDLLRELRAAEGERKAHAEHYFELAIDLTAMLLSAEEGEFLRRRGRAATGTQAAA
jgi:hypothetical protein